MKHSQKITAQQLVSACLSYGIERVVISPGSRNAPLIIEFNAYDNIKKYSIVDERSAAFFALGMALHTQNPVALVCSSGSALLNYYPAIAEAFYSKIPLIVISADRPKHLIDVGDGQTIRQENVYQNHICYSANLDETDLEFNYGLLNSAFESLTSKMGPIHINIPFDEPLYETTSDFLIDDNQWIKNKQESLLIEDSLDVDELEKFAQIWNNATRKMVLLGVSQPSSMLQTQLEHIIKDPSVIVLTENTSNVIHKQFVNSIDQAIFPLNENLFEEYRPEILLTFGGMVISKKIKQLLRNSPPKQHWHIDSVEAMDTYHCLTKHFVVSPTMFFSQFFFLTKPKSNDYQQKWLKLKEARAMKHQYFIERAPFSDLKVFATINQNIPEHLSVQFSNSSTIRYAQLFTWSKTLRISCNRGTSGIDGSTSTAVGVSVANEEQTLFVTGDLSFFYDSNAIWNSYIPSDFRIIVINNGGGGIFRFIPGPTTTNTLDYFETPHQLTAENLCKMHQISYKKAQDINGLEKELQSFFDDSKKPKLLEIFTPKEINAEVLKSYFNNL